mmetsp:Transcript_8700/g.32075  ORF Transcript_8700/g.32075 Transcript_8700/m.32075 type:complete len:217 (-) Transcript_8700:1015-1665(-)
MNRRGPPEAIVPTLATPLCVARSCPARRTKRHRLRGWRPVLLLDGLLRRNPSLAVGERPRPLGLVAPQHVLNGELELPVLIQVDTGQLAVVLRRGATAVLFRQLVEHGHALHALGGEVQAGVVGAARVDHVLPGVAHASDALAPLVQLLGHLGVVREHSHRRLLLPQEVVRLRVALCAQLGGGGRVQHIRCDSVGRRLARVGKPERPPPSFGQGIN